MKLVTPDQFVQEFAGKGTRFATIYSATRPKLLKKHRITGEPCQFPQGVERRAIRSVQFGAVYENSVNNQRQREGIEEEFTAGGLWVSNDYPNGAGKRLDSFRVIHQGTGKEYFAIKPAGNSEGRAIVQEDYWIDLATDEIIDDSTVENILPHYLPKPQADSGRQETEKIIPWRTFAVENVIAVQCGEFFVLTSAV